MRRFGLVALFSAAACVALVLLLSAHTGSIAGVVSHNGQDPVIHIRAEAGELLTVRRKHLYFEHDAGLSLYGPDGRLLARDVFPWGSDGTVSYQLNAGSGDYRVVLSEPRWLWSLSVPGAKCVLEPPRRWPSFVCEPENDLEWYFDVPAGAADFTLHANGFGGAATVTLFRPDRTLHVRLVVEEGDPDESVTVSSPEPGLWHWRGKGSRVGVWLTGLPNLFACAVDDYFVPKAPDTSASIAVDTGRIVGPLAWHAVQFTPHTTGSYRELAPELGWLGFRAVRLLLGDDIEAANDNADPFHTDWSRFDFSGWRYDGQVDLFRQHGVELFMPILDADQIWNTRPPWSAVQREEFAEFCVAVIEHANVVRDDAITYWEIYNEPEWTIGDDPEQPADNEYLALFEAVRNRVRSHSDRRVSGVSLGGPTLGSMTHTYMNTRLMERLLEGFDFDVDFLSWHTYNHGDPDDTWRYGDDQHRVDAIRRNFGDRRPDELLVLSEHNSYPGTPVVPEVIDSHQQSLWYTSAFIQQQRNGMIFMTVYYELLDESTVADGTQHKKGLIAGVPGNYIRKPVAHAAWLINKSVLEVIVSSSTNHEGLELLATRDAAGDRVNLLLVNKTRRSIAIEDAALSLPAGRWYRADASLGPAAPTSATYAIAAPVDVALSYPLSSVMEALTIRSITFSRSDLDPDGDGMPSPFDNRPD